MASSQQYRRAKLSIRLLNLDSGGGGGGGSGGAVSNGNCGGTLPNGNCSGGCEDDSGFMVTGAGSATAAWFDGEGTATTCCESACGNAKVFCRRLVETPC